MLDTKVRISVLGDGCVETFYDLDTLIFFVVHLHYSIAFGFKKVCKQNP
jgi:hypothetical protein